MFLWYTIIYGAIFGFLMLYFFIGDSGSNIIDNIPILIIYFFLGAAIASAVFILRFNSIKNKPYEIGSCFTYEISKHDNNVLYNIVEEMTIASGLNKTPKVYILDSDILNAYACGFTPETSSIVVSKGLLKILTRDELQGVIAHEISHIVNRDTTYLLCSGALYVIAAGVSAFFLRSRARGKGAGLILIMLLLSLIGQGICFILFKFISRKREYLADACACQYTRYPQGLANALLKIETNQKICITKENPNNLVKASFIVPLEKNELFSTHPLTSNRIKILTSMASADYRAYEKEFEKLNNKSLIPKRIIDEAGILPINNIENPSVVSPELIGVCAITSSIKNEEQLNTIKTNKNIIKENIENHRKVENMIRDLSGYKIINCECETKLKIPPVYKNQIIICPHCKKRHAIKD